MHTPLLRSLVNAVRKGQQELQKVKDENELENYELTRRDLLKTGTLIAATAMVPSFVTNSIASAEAAESKSIAIIGGGLAGLSAAFRLNQNGIKTTLFEGNTRLGGRCWSAGKGWDSGFTNVGQYEMGGELIDTIHTELMNLVEELNKDYKSFLHKNTPIELDNMYDAEPEGTHDLYYFDGKPYPFDRAVQDLKSILKYVQDDYKKSGFPTTYKKHTSTGKILDSMSIRDYLYGAPSKSFHSHTLAARAGSLLKKETQKLLEIAYVTEYGAEIEQQNALNLVYLFGTATKKNPWMFGESDEAYHIRGGNEAVVRTLTNIIKSSGTNIQLGHTLTDISKNSKKQYVLTFKNGIQQTFDIIICAIPFSILREILTVDKMKALNFKKEKIDAITHYAIGNNTKHYLLFEKRYWHEKECNGSTLSNLSTHLTWETTRNQITTGSSITDGAGIINVFTGGDLSYKSATSPLANVTKKAVNDLNTIMPGIKEHFTNQTSMMPWPVWQFSKGAYSYYGVGQYTKFAGVEIESEGNMYFCGEHTSLNYQGYLNGAIETGEIAASKIVKALQKASVTIG